LKIKWIQFILIKIKSNKLALAFNLLSLWVRTNSRYVFPTIENLPDWVLEYLLESLPCQCTAFLINAIDSLESLSNLCFSQRSTLSKLWWSQIYFVTNQDKRSSRNSLMHFIVSLNNKNSTFFITLIRVDLFTTEVVIKKKSVGE
jgi:hypothetical protein